MSAATRTRLLRVLHGWGFAVSIPQLINGTIETSLTPHYPALEHALHASLGVWGLVLTGIPIGLLFGAPIGGLIAGGLKEWAPIGKLIARALPKRVVRRIDAIERSIARVPLQRVTRWIWEGFGSRAALLIGGVLFFGVPSLAGVVPTSATLWLVLFLAGLSNGIFDVGWVLQATNFELQHQHDPRLKDANLGFNALFSLGSLLGVASAAAALELHWNTLPHMAGVGATGIAAVLLTARRLPAAPERVPHREAEDDSAEETRPVSAGWLAFTGLCAASFFGFFPIGAAYSWSTPYLESIGAKAGFATFGLIAYTLFEGVGCLIVIKWHYLHSNKRRTVVLGASLALAGALMILGPAQPLPVIVGFGLLSLGLGPAGPIIQSASNRAAAVGQRAVRMALLSTSAYLGGVVGQPVIGEIAVISSLRASMGLLAVCAVVVLALARVVPVANASRSRKGRHRRRGLHRAL